MKKIMTIAMTVAIILGAMSSRADQSISDDYYDMQGKIEAAEFDMTRDQIQKQIQELDMLQTDLGDLEDSHGLIKAIGETIHIAKLELQTARRNLDLEMAKELSKNLKEALKEFKAKDPRVSR